MTTPTPIRELCAKATKGPWFYEYSPANKAFELAPLGPDGEMDWDHEICVTADDNEPNAELIARLDPQTVLMVVQALETASEALTHDVPESCWARGQPVCDTIVAKIAALCVCPGCSANEQIAAALRALNGQRDGGGE